MFSQCVRIYIHSTHYNMYTQETKYHWCGQDICSMFLRSGLQESSDFCCLHRVILRLKSERILAPALQQEVCHILHIQTPTTAFMQKIHKCIHTHMQLHLKQSLTAGQKLMPKKAGTCEQWVHSTIEYIDH